MGDQAERVNLLGMDRAGLEAFVAGFGAKAYRARQLLKWIYRRGEPDFTRMTDLAKDFRAELARRAEIRVPGIVADRVASDGTRKWLLRMPGAAGNEQVIETVFIPEAGRGTLCIATFRQPKSSARSGSPTASSATTRTASASSPTSC